MRFASAQVRTIDGDVHGNLSRCYLLAEQAVSEGADLIALPELASTGYCTDDYVPFIEELDGPVVSRFQNIVSRDEAMIVVGLITANEDGVPLNSALVIGPNGAEGIYSKTHLCINSLPRFDESRCFAAGQDINLFNIDSWHFGVMICYDGHHPELPRILTLEGADFLVWINNRSAIEEWEALAIAKSNMIPIVLVNRVGEGVPGMLHKAFPGRSVICDHTGLLLSDAADREEAVVVTEIDLEEGRKRRRLEMSLNTIESRRLDLYGDKLADLASWQYRR